MWTFSMYMGLGDKGRQVPLWWQQRRGWPFAGQGDRECWARPASKQVKGSGSHRYLWMVLWERGYWGTWLLGRPGCPDHLPVRPLALCVKWDPRMGTGKIICTSSWSLLQPQGLMIPCASNWGATAPRGRFWAACCSIWAQLLEASILDICVYTFPSSGPSTWSVREESRTQGLCLPGHCAFTQCGPGLCVYVL